MLQSVQFARFAPMDAVIGVAYTAIDGLAALLTPLGGAAGAAAIVLFTVAVRLLLSPLTYLQVRGERRRAALAPLLAQLRARHRADPVRLAAETVAAQRAAGAGPLAGCLPALAQAPFFMIMYRLVTVPAAGAAPGLLAGTVLGVPLTAHLLTAPALPGGLVFGALLTVATVLAWWSARRLRRLQAGAGEPAADAAPGQAGPGGRAADADRGRAGAGEPAAGAERVQLAVARVLPLLPYATVVMVVLLPLAGGIYLVTNSAWTALEHALWRRPAPVAAP